MILFIKFLNFIGEGRKGDGEVFLIKFLKKNNNNLIYFNIKNKL